MMIDDGIAKVSICLLGGFRIEGGQSRQIGLTGRRGPAIIAYLARCPRMAAPREKLADLLWGDSDGDHSRNSLRQTLSLLRRDLARAGVDIIQSGKDMIGLKADAVGVDVETFEAGLAARSPQELETALAVYSGPFLEGFHVGCNPFDDWVAAERDRLLDRALESFEKLARLVEPGGRLRPCRPAACDGTGAGGILSAEDRTARGRRPARPGDARSRRAGTC